LRTLLKDPGGQSWEAENDRPEEETVLEGTKKNGKEEQRGRKQTGEGVSNVML
jgi:hypothetical protein